MLCSSTWRAIFVIEGKYAAAAFGEATPLLSDTFEVQRIARAITFHAKVLMILYRTIPNETNIKNIKVAFFVSVNKCGQVVKLKFGAAVEPLFL